MQEGSAMEKLKTENHIGGLQVFGGQDSQYNVDVSLKVLLTGSTGFIGRHLKEAWNGKYNISAPTRQELDLMDTQAVEQYLQSGCFDVVVHAANMNNVRRQITSGQELDGNLRMFCNLERCSRLFGKMYYFGSGAEYDMQHYIPSMSETYFGAYIPTDPYGFSKYMMSKMSGGNIYDLRLFGVFGEYEEWQRRFISNMFYQNLSGNEMRMNQNMYFDYIYIQDLVPVLEWFLTHEPKHHHYNVCSGTRIALLSLAHMVSEVTGISSEICVAKDGWKPEYTGDNHRLLEEIGVLPLTPMPEAIGKMAAYYQKNGFPNY